VQWVKNCILLLWCCLTQLSFIFTVLQISCVVIFLVTLVYIHSSGRSNIILDDWAYIIVTFL